MRTYGFLRALRCALGLCLLFAPLSAAKDRLQRPLFVDVSFAGKQGSERLRERIQRALLERLATHGCFDDVQLVSSDRPVSETDLVLAVEIIDVHEQSNFDLSIAAMSDPNSGPNADRRLTARLQIDYRSLLRLGSSGPKIRARTMRSVGAHRPLLDEDPRLEAQDKAIFDLTRGMGRFSCKGGPAKVEKAIESAFKKAASQ